MIGLIVARSNNNVIGKGGEIPWRIKGEQKQFKELTTGNIVVMGRRSYEEIGHPLPSRTTIVVSRTKQFEGDGVQTAGSVREAIEMAGDRDVFIAGGYGLYKEAIPLVDIMYITEVDLTVENGDVFFPDFNEEDFEKTTGETLGEEIRYTRTIYRRKRGRDQQTGGNRIKALLFDLFETLITEWGHEKYTKRKMCADLGVDKEEFDVLWEEKEEERYLGEIDFEGSILYAGSKLGREISAETLAYVLNRRMSAKAACFEHIDPEVFRLLEELRSRGFRTAIVSNCSSEEVKVIRESELFRYFDEVVLSYEVHKKKPDRGIYEEAARRLGVDLADCIFVGDGGSNELQGAENAGMKAIQAKWYTNRLPQKRETIGAYPVAEEPLEVLKLIVPVAE
ncbi:MAG: HAD-IA family hydrolase [Lachnospiraceae bacterium]|nr:HAD-IA family hydrolase [Lachnospiraceae bacterium]